VELAQLVIKRQENRFGANPEDVEQRAQPGTRAPHLWLGRDGTPVSTHDLFGDAFVLLTGAGG
jgi:hypothetical protein